MPLGPWELVSWVLVLSGKATGEELVYGPNIKDWPQMSALSENILLKALGSSGLPNRK